MLSSDKSGRLAWLTAALSGHRERLSKLLRRMTGAGVPGAMTPSAFTKFLHMLDQVAVERDKEMHLIDEIEQIEKKHHSRLKDHRLETVHTGKTAPETAPEPEPEAEKSGLDLLGLAALWHFFVRDKNKL